MKNYLIILLLCFASNRTTAVEQIIIKNKAHKRLYISDNKYTNPFPYNIEMKCNNIKYDWNKSLLMINLKDIKHNSYGEFVNLIPNIIYDFKKNFHKNSEDYFKYLIKNDTSNIIYNNNIQIYDLECKKYILTKYDNPFNKNPFVFKIDDTIFQWKDSKIFTKECNNLYRNKINNILINSNDSFQYFKYLLKKVVEVQSLKINITCNKNIDSNYKSLTFNTSFDNPFNNIIVIKDCVRTYRWDENTIDILFPDWLNDNLSKNNYSVFLKLFENATNKFLNSKSKYIKLENFEYFIRQELGEHILVYELNTDDFNWENIENINSNYTSAVENSKTGFVEIEYNKVKDYDWENDEDDF